MKQIRKKGYVLAWSIIFVLGSGILYKGIINLPHNGGSHIEENIVRGISNWLTTGLFPGISYVMKEPEDSESKIKKILNLNGQLQPVVSFVEEQVWYETQRESSTTYEEILAMEASDENHINEKGELVLAEGAVSEAETLVAQHVIDQFAVKNEQAETGTGEAAAQEAVNSNVQNVIVGKEYAVEQLNYNFLINHFYTLDSTTSVTAGQLDAQKLLTMDMTMKTDKSKPQILIYHTHSQEDFVDSVKGDASTTIVGVGAYLTKLLQEQYGYQVIHNTKSYDLVNGKLDRNKAYSLALVDINKILEENPSIEVVIDLHRDGVEGVRLVTDINGKPTARLMFFNGLSYTNKNGAISYLKNPYIQENLSLSLKLQIEAAKYYPGVTRKIYLKGYRYNLHVRPKALLVEVGAQNNTLEEEKNAMEPLADILNKVFKGKNE